MKFLYGIYFFLRYLVDGGRLAYSHSEISFVGKNEGVNGDIRYSDIVAKTRVNFVSNSISFVPVRVIRVIICGSFL